MKLLGGKRVRSQLLPFLTLADPDEPKEDGSSLAFNTPMINSFSPPDTQDDIFPRLQGAGSDNMSSKQVHIEVPVDRQTISKYSFVSRTVDSAVVCKSLFYH